MRKLSANNTVNYYPTGNYYKVRLSGAAEDPSLVRPRFVQREQRVWGMFLKALRLFRLQQ